MSQTNIEIDPLTTQCVLQYMGLAIDEIKLVRTINSISEQVVNSNASHLASGRKHYLVSELRYLKKRLRRLREQAAAKKTHAH